MSLSSTYVGLFGACTLLGLLLAHRLIAGRLGGTTDRQATLEANPALALREVGSILALFLIGSAVVKGTLRGESVGADAAWCAAFAGLGLVLLEVTSFAGLGLIMKRNLRESLDRGNVAAGLTTSAHHVAMGLLTSKAVAGNDLRGLGLSVTFFGIGVVSHQLLVALFRVVTTYDDAEQIDGENTAAALSYAGMTLGVALVISRALEGDFVDWRSSLTGFAALVSMNLAFYPMRQLVVQGLLLGAKPSLRGGGLDDAIGRDRKLGVAALEAGAYLGGALAIVTLA
ncbi:MAG: DUF350 domain-containing protein [Deltaproteobacteria bacterium]|nr:DUF350 domain-containing protein [Deltaproteobacteria bacterium]